MAENNEIPKNADKLLFAQDLMNHVMKHTVGATYTAMTAESYRDVIYTAFNETIIKAVSFLYNKVEMENKNIISAMLNEESVNIASYTIYAKDLEQKYFTKGFDFSGFLQYCVCLAGVAANLYHHGVVEAPNLAVTYIVNALDNVDMTTGGWDALNTVGGKFASIENDTVNQLSPQSSFSEESSSSMEHNMDESSPSHAIVIQVGSSFLLNEDFKMHEVQIEKVSVEDFNQHSNSSSSSVSKEDSKEFKECCSTSSGNSSNFGETKVVSGSSSPETFGTGTSNTTGISVRSMKKDYLDMTLKEINHESAQNVPLLTSENESAMLGVTSSSERHNSDSEENKFSNKET